VEVPEGEGGPGGMTLDADGHLLSARWNGHGVFIYSPAGELIEKIAIAAARPSACIFGGPNMDELYVTSAAAGDATGHNGALFRITGSGRTGRPEFRSKVLL